MTEHTEVPEPSAERLMQAPAIQAAREVLDHVSDRMDEHAYSEISSALDDIPDCESATAMPHDEHREPQGEPSDAQVEAALIAHLGYDPAPAGFPFKDGEKDQMRAALRAAEGAKR